jgi:hypothetical protein
MAPGNVRSARGVSGRGRAGAVAGVDEGTRGYARPMAGRDDDDWVGTPPEGRHSRDRADPGFWANQWQAAAAGAVLFVLVVIVLLLALL